jgi:CheY-like chemotaxis protein
MVTPLLREVYEPTVAVQFPEPVSSFLNISGFAVCDIACCQHFRVVRFWRAACLYPCMADKVLIIDDDQQLRNAYRAYLEQCGYTIDCAQELEEAQTLLAYHDYSVVVTDLRLNKLQFGGLDVVKQVHESHSRTRVVVLTAYGWPELKAEASSSGADAFLQKPLQLKELEKTISRLTGVQA